MVIAAVDASFVRRTLRWPAPSDAWPTTSRTLLALWHEFRLETRHSTEPLYHSVYRFADKFESDTAVPHDADAVSLCSEQPLKHIACAAPCVLKLVTRPQLNNCPICRAPLTPLVALMQREARSHALALAYKEQTIAARDALRAKIDEQIEALQIALARATETDTYWAVRAERRSGAAVRSRARDDERGARDFTVHVAFDRADGNGAERVQWRRSDADRDESAIVQTQSISGPWPRLVRDDELVFLMRELLGIELHRLRQRRHATSVASDAIGSSLADGAGDLSTVVEAARATLQHEATYALRYYSESMALDEHESRWRAQLARIATQPSPSSVSFGETT